MTVKKALAIGLVLLAALVATSATAFHWLPFSTAVARGQDKPHARPSHGVSHRPVASQRRVSPLRLASPPLIPQHHGHPVVAASRHTRVARPQAAWAVRQVGGREPVMRVLAPGAWINTSSLSVIVHMSSAMGSAYLQPQVELRPLGQPFTGHPTASGAVTLFAGTPVLGTVHLRGLRDGVSYHWRVRVHDTLGANSAWIDPYHGHAALRVHLAAPAAPAVSLVTPSQPGGWVATRRLTVRWTPPSDRSGIRGYSYTLSRSHSTAPALHLRTALSGVTVRARAGGLWYFTVRALNYAHTWGPPAQIALRIDTAIPRLTGVQAPSGAINIRRTHRLVDATFTARARLMVDILTAGGHVVRSIPTHFHAAGYHCTIYWDGTDTHGHAVPNGTYSLRISTTTPAGVRWQTVRPLRLMDQGPVLATFGLSQTGTYNPYNNDIDGPEVITAALSEPASVRIEATHDNRVVRVWRVAATHTGQVVSVTWDGSIDGMAMPPGGLYKFRAIALDAAGNQTTTELGWVVLDHRRIVVSLDAQRLWALDGNRVLLTTLVTTGGPELPTPAGEFQIIDRESPFTFHSLYPPGSPYWYPDSPTNFALLFQWNGYFIHDAPWRTYYGPGSNAVDGTPGSNTTGTHGCVNVPYDPMAWLYNWATMYTPVQVRQDFTPS